MLTAKQDAFGQGILEYYDGRADQCEIVERDDGLITVGFGPKIYFEDFKNWRPHEKKAAQYIKGRVLDIGCGAGRVALYLQNKGHQVIGIDQSPLAIKVCRMRGLKHAKVLPVTKISKSLGTFDTIIMFCNNFCLGGNPKTTRWLLKKFHGMTTVNGRIVAESLDPYNTDEKMHKDYHRWNRQRGRMGGQTRLRVRYKMAATPWFDLLMVSQKEAQQIIMGTGWKVSKVIQSNTPKGPAPRYIMIIDKER